MTINEAYNKGLDDAENLAYDKLTRALEGIDSGPFINPIMEELRQKILDNDLKKKSLCDENVPVGDHLTCEELKNILLYQGIAPFRALSLEEMIVYDVLTKHMAFIYPKASKGNNGSKNYVKMVEDIRNGLLTTDENVIK